MSENSLREQLVGAWALSTFVERDIETGVENHPFGKRPLSLVLYTPDRYVSAQLQRPERDRPCAEHLGPPTESWWRDLGHVTLNEELNAAISRAVTEELGSADLARLTSQRDDVLLAVLQLKADADRLP